MSVFSTLEFGQNDDHMKVVSNKSHKFKKDQLNRVAVASWAFGEDGFLDVSGNPKIIGAPVSWVDGKGYVVHSTDEFTKLIGEAPKFRCACVLVIFPTTDDGKLDTLLFKHGRWQVVPWAFSERKYNDLKIRHVNHGLDKKDLQIKCTNEGYQNLEYDVYPESMLSIVVEKARAAKEAGDKPEFVAMIEKLMVEVRKTQETLQRLIGREIDIDELREHLGGGGSDSESGIAAAVASAEGESVLDDMLEDMV